MRPKRLSGLACAGDVDKRRARANRQRNQLFGFFCKFERAVVSLSPVRVGTSRKQPIPIPTKIAIKAVLSAREYVFLDKLSNATLGQTEIERNLLRCSPSSHWPIIPS
jgi:hypothetical protein